MAVFQRFFHPDQYLKNLTDTLLARKVLSYNFQTNEYEKHEDGEYGLVPQIPSQSYTYTRSGTSTIHDHTGRCVSLPANIPPFVRQGGRRYSGILIEPSSTNLVLQSVDYSNANWVKLGGSISRPSSTVNLDNVGLSYQYNEDTSTSEHTLSSTIIVPSNTTNFTISVYVSLDSIPNDRYLRFLVSTDGTGTSVLISATIDNQGKVIHKEPTYQTVVEVSQIPTDFNMSPNRWVRLTVTRSPGPGTNATLTAGSKLITLQLVKPNVSVLPAYDNAYAGDPSVGFSVYGMQAESRSNVTSFIPTTTVTATRASSNISIPVSQKIPTLWNIEFIPQQGIVSSSRIPRFMVGATELYHMMYSPTATATMGLSNCTRPSTFRYGKDGILTSTYNHAEYGSSPNRLLIYSNPANQLTTVLFDGYPIIHTHRNLPTYDNISIDGAFLGGSYIISKIEAFEGVYTMKELAIINRLNRGEL